MPTAENAKLQYEAGQNAAGFTLLTNAAADYIDYKSAVNLWSNRAGYVPSVKPNGLATGGVITPAISGTNDLVDVAALTCYIAGVLTSVGAATDETCLRGATTDIYRTNSLTVTSGGAIAVVAGTDHTAVSETRGATGGPPWIDNNAIEIGQVRFILIANAAVVASEIKQVNGVHQERYDYPTWVVEHYDVESGIIGYAGVKFNAALAAIHSEDAGSTVAGKLVYVSYYTPSFADVPQADAFVRPGEAHSVGSKQIYGSVLGSVSKTLNQGGFTAYLLQGVTDGLLLYEGANLLFKFFPDKLNSEYILTQGILGIVESYPAGDEISAVCTISAAKQGVRVTG